MSRLWGRFKLWFMSTSWAWLLVFAASLAGRKRMSHNNGTTLRGRVRVVDSPSIPPNRFFVPGREWPCRLRHSSVSYDDDTVIQVRSASLKFADSSYDSPLDLELNTGTISLFWSASNFLEFFVKKSRVRGIPCDFVKFYEKYERGHIAALDGIREDPSSFAQMHYHSQVAQRFEGEDGLVRYVHYRLLPEGGGPETGIVPPGKYSPYWPEDRRPGETKSPHYLKKEIAERVRAETVRYVLQIQLREPAEGEDPEIFNCNRVWDETLYPYVDLAHVTLDEVLSYEENQLMRFSLGHTPIELGNLPAYSPTDYNSVVYMRIKSGPAKAARLMAYKLFGMPKPVPES